MLKTNFIGNTMIYNELLLLSFFSRKEMASLKKIGQK